MQRYQEGCLTKVKRKGGEHVWTYRWYETTGVKRTYRKRVIGKVTELPTRRDAELAVTQIRSVVNSRIETPETVEDLITHYTTHELTAERKAFASRETHRILAGRYIKPKWGNYRLSAIRTVQVEQWLDALPGLAPASKTKIKSTFSVLFTHAIRHELIQFNPICKVRTSSKPLREKDVLTPEEFGRLLSKLSVRDRAMVLLAGSTGLRRSEFIALTWGDVNTTTMEVSVTRSCFRNRFGETKTQASRRPVPLHPLVLEALTQWRMKTPFAGTGDFLFASLRKNGSQPLSPDSLLKRSIRPALKAAEITGKVIGWHNFRHTLASMLRDARVDVKLSQDLLRHSTSRMTLDVYTHTASAEKHEATGKVIEMMLGGSERKAG